ncbi:MAG: sulfopyruvate decarboxylase subunit beta [Asgard group archaeon]|nr:sulfopyruvate decarboxylase subunit beta [Asgard group archaeon]
MKSYEVISELKHHIVETDIIVSSNGNISREAFHYLPKPQVYLRGSMGLPVSVGLGLALANTAKRVIVITGDGNFLMGLGSMVSAAFYKPDNLKILILDNQKYFTTGGQQTTSSKLDYLAFLKSLDVSYAYSAEASIKTIAKDLNDFINSETFSALHLTIEEGKENLENIPWHPEEITRRVIQRLR